LSEEPHQVSDWVIVQRLPKDCGAACRRDGSEQRGRERSMVLPVLCKRRGHRKVAGHPGPLAQMRKVARAKVHAVQSEEIGGRVSIIATEMVLRVVDRLRKALQRKRGRVGRDALLLQVDELRVPRYLGSRDADLREGAAHGAKSTGIAGM
jgi:hypothetical protein